MRTLDDELPVSITSDVDHGQGCSVWAISASAMRGWDIGAPQRRNDRDCKYTLLLHS